MNLEAIKNAVLAAIAAAGSYIANQLGGWDTALAVLIGIMLADYVTGILVAWIWHKSNKTDTGGVSSAAGFKGLFKKCMILVFVWIGSMLDHLIGAEYVRTAVILFYVANEGLSIIENTAIMGLPYPAFIKKALEAMREKNDAGGATNE